MNIAVIGAGAMGMLFGGYLTRENDVTLLDVDPRRVASIASGGVTVREKDGRELLFHPKAALSGAELPPAELVIVFVKSMYTAKALAANRGLLGPETYLLTLQNGGGHEEILGRFAGMDRVIIGTTQHNASAIEGGTYHGGSGPTTLGLPGGGVEGLSEIAYTFSRCGLECQVSRNVLSDVWRKLFTNTAASALTAALQVPLGFIASDAHANTLMRTLCHEAVETANALGAGPFQEGEVVETVEAVCRGARDGVTSIRADIDAGRPTEVDAISGYVVRAARRAGVPVPVHEALVELIHALEGKAGN